MFKKQLHLVYLASALNSLLMVHMFIVLEIILVQHKAHLWRFPQHLADESSRQSARASFVGSSTNLEVGRLDNSMVVILTAGKKYYYKITGTANGGYINPSSASTGFTLIKINDSKTF